ncbi:MAG: LON peptidase substrate-binding domain-containing protein [Planctomycetota bacterium]
MSRIRPVFPLPNLILYPGSLVPLHLFEPRYVQMMEEMLAADQDELVAATLAGDWEDQYFEEPSLYPVAGLGQVQQVARDAQDNFNLVLRGEERVQILGEEESSEAQQYRKIRIATVAEPKVAAKGHPELLAELLQLLSYLTGQGVAAQDGDTLNYLSDVSLVQMPLPMEEKLRLFAMADPVARATALVEAWRRMQNRPEPPPSASGFHPDSN